MKDNQAKYPQLRFKGFTDPWEQRKLGKMGYTFTGLSGKTKEDFGHGNAKFVTYMNVFSSPVSNSEMVENVEVDSKQHQVEYGDVFFTTSSETPQEVGMSSVWLETAENIYLNSFCFGYHPMVEFDPYYLAFMLRSPVIRKKFMLLAQGISRYNISKNKVMEMLLPVPEIVEQQKIGSFFKQLDDTITLHQRKLAMLKELKQGYLQKMFPKNGSKFPQLRFAGFADAWEQRKLTEIVNRVNKSSNSDVLPKVEFEDIVSGEGRLNKDISSKLDSRKGTLFESENILYGKLRPYLKNWLFPDFEGVALGDFWVFEATDVSVPSFDYYLIQSDDYQKVANDTSGTKMPRSDWKNVSSTDFAIPSKDEQKQIGTFFKQLDNTITLHQRKLDLLKEQKKGFLQKMFV